MCVYFAVLFLNVCIYFDGLKIIAGYIDDSLNDTQHWQLKPGVGSFIQRYCNAGNLTPPTPETEHFDI